MSRLKRTQLILQTLEGELVTSLQLEFEGVVNEYITVAALAWLIDRDSDWVAKFLGENGLIMRERHGQLWVNCAGLMPLFD